MTRRTSKSCARHIKQATLIPTPLLGSREGASEEPPNSTPVSFSFLRARAPTPCSPTTTIFFFYPPTSSTTTPAQCPPTNRAKRRQVGCSFRFTGTQKKPAHLHGKNATLCGNTSMRRQASPAGVKKPQQNKEKTMSRR